MREEERAEWKASIPQGYKTETKISFDNFSIATNKERMLILLVAAIERRQRRRQRTTKSQS